jgi:competence protein ComEC
VIDVGQGDAILLQAPGGKVVLIDTGRAGARQTLLAYLRNQGVERIDLLVHSHAHADHVGNTAAVVDTFDVGAVLDPGFPHPAKAYGRALAALEHNKVPMKLARRGRTIRIGQKTTLTVLAPDTPFLSQTRSDVNANSVILRIDYGRVRILLTGDAEHETEKRLLAAGPKTLRAQVLKVAHHGSRFATHRPFLDAVEPELALISAGVDNAYGHPAKKTLARLARHGTAIAITGRDGHLLLETDGKRLKLVRKSTANPPSEK